MESQKTVLCEFESDDAGFSTSSSESLETEQPKKMPGTGNRNMIPIPTIALEADRCGVSNRATAAQIDYGAINPNDKANIIDHHKVWRARQNTRKELSQSEDFITTNITAIFFDSRKDQTLTKSKLGEQWYRRTATEDHYVLLEPGSIYLDHITVTQGTGSKISEGIQNYAEDGLRAPKYKSNWC